MDRLSDYDYDLPEDLIAQTPLENRAESRLLALDRASGKIEDRAFAEVVEILQPGDLLVWNDTRVSALRLIGRKSTGGAVEALLIAPLGDGRFSALLKPSRRLKGGATIEFEGGLTAMVAESLDEPLRVIDFGNLPDLRDRLARIGAVPLPPYITEHLADPERYQTVYSKSEGSAAAPTAGLHFTPEIVSALKSKGVRIAHVTLDVSLDTFRPVMSEALDDHKMHGETCRISEGAAREVNSATGRIIAVGTTTARTLESFAVGPRKVAPGEMKSKLFIRPGYKWKVVDGMFTNFHMPKTTMLMMISSLAGKPNIMSAYRHAVRHRYRFLSFGDSMLIL